MNKKLNSEAIELGACIECMNPDLTNLNWGLCLPCQRYSAEKDEEYERWKMEHPNRAIRYRHRGSYNFSDVAR